MCVKTDKTSVYAGNRTQGPSFGRRKLYPYATTTARRHVTSNIFMNMSRVRRHVLFVAFHLGKKKIRERGSKSFLPFAFHPTLQQRLFSKKCLSTIALVKQKKSSQQKDQWKNFERKALMKHWMKYLDKKYGNATTAFFLMGLLKSLKYQNDKSYVFE